MNNILHALIFLLLISFSPLACAQKGTELPLLKVSENQRFLMTEDADPFFWLGDTGWLLFKKLDRAASEKYLEDRKQKGYNVIQVMLIHDTNNATNIYGDTAFTDKSIANLNVTKGSDFLDEKQYDYWDHVDYIIKLAEEKGLYMALVPIWGSNVKGGAVTEEEAATYASFLANRYKSQSNIIWLNGGDILGSDTIDVWKTIGKTIKEIDSNHLMTFHPIGRTMSSDWFHNETWLDFNMFQTGHRRYDQDDTERNYGEDGWRYVNRDYEQHPMKPTIDGEPSYEHIPQGLHDSLQPKWNGDDARRYAYWSVFAGALGHTYGHNSIMQFFGPNDTEKGFFTETYWVDAMNDPGGLSMQYLKELIESKPFFERIPDQTLIAEDQGKKYNYLIATRGENFAMIYTYTGRSFSIDGTKLKSSKLRASWFNPRNGESTLIGTFKNETRMTFDPPGAIKDGNDWVLVLEVMA